MGSFKIDIIEAVSEEIHEMWTTWAKEILKTEKGISPIRKKRWKEECFKPYLELSEAMKDLDRKFAIKILDRIYNKVIQNKNEIHD